MMDKPAIPVNDSGVEPDYCLEQIRPITLQIYKHIFKLPNKTHTNYSLMSWRRRN